MQKQKDEMLVVRKVNKRVYRRFRQRALDENKNVGEAVTEAMEYWLREKERKKKPNIKNLLKMNGIIKTGGKVRWSEEIDEVLYGGST